MEEGLFGTAAAAKYVGLSPSSLRYHIYKGHLTPARIGNSLVFTREQRDEFKATKRSPGRPRGT
jgi:hypothetical protein